MRVQVFDVATYILAKCGSMTAMKLHKLLYYCQAWSLVWDDKPLFREPIEAWVNGPVIPKLYQTHRGEFTIRGLADGDAGNLQPAQIETIDAVLEAYGKKTAQQLVELTHGERPWSAARKGLAEDERGAQVISQAVMAEYYSSL